MDVCMTNSVKQEFAARIVAANPSRLVEIIYEIMIIYIQESIDCHETGTRMEFSVQIKKARACLLELEHSIQKEHPLAENFIQLYEYCHEKLTQADARYEVAPLKEVERVITRFRETYEEIAKKDQSDPVMDNAQSIYAGLTYGKNTLNENLSGEGDNRGFLI